MRKPHIDGTVKELKDHRGRKTGMVEVSIAGFEATGKSVEDCETEIALSMKRMAGNDPRVVHYCGWTAIMFPRSDSWWYTIISGPDREFSKDYPVQSGCTSSLEDSYEASLDALFYLLAQRAWEPALGFSLPGSEMMVEFLQRSLKRRKSKYNEGRTLWDEWMEWTEFQMRYFEARKRGMSDDDCHSYAGRNPCRSELWSHEVEVA